MKRSGIIVLNKDPGMTSHTATNIVKRLMGASKAGHCGTLDPNAGGVLPVMLGGAVKAAEFLTKHTKGYEAELVLGRETDTGDITGNLLREYHAALPAEDALREAVASFEGGYDQIPPMYSALKVGGVKLVDAARKGINIKRPPRRVDIYSIRLLKKGERFYIATECSRGTYIRTLCEDIGKKLGVPACMGALTRYRVGHFTLEHAVTLDDLARFTEEEREAMMIPAETALSDFLAVHLDSFFAYLIQNGQEVETRKLGLENSAPGDMFRLYDKGVFFALGCVAEKEGKTVLKHKKLFL